MSRQYSGSHNKLSLKLVIKIMELYLESSLCVLLIIIIIKQAFAIVAMLVHIAIRDTIRDTMQ